MLYIMLGIIIFLLTFCVLGVSLPDNEKGSGFIFTMGLVINVILGIVLGIIYFFFK